MSNKFETAYTPERIINEGFRFRIPLYQRPYTWETKQVEQLMQDLLDSYRDDHQKPYYIGIMNIAPTEVDANLMDLIDGQQRFTTLSIMALILKDFCENWKDFCGKLDFYGREEDKRFLENGLGAQNITAKMIEAKSAVENYVNKIKSGEIKTDLQLFAKYVFLHASFFFSEIPQDYSIIDKNNQFVRMNNRGKQLEMVDILKVKLLDVLNKDEENSNDTFLQEWNKYSQMNCDSEKELNYEEKTIEMILKEDNEGKEETGKEIYHESIVSFEEFLLIALQRYIEDNSIISQKPDLSINWDTSKLLRTFGFDGENKIQWEANQVTDFMNVLNKQYDDFKEFFIRKDKTEKYKWQNVEEDKNLVQKRQSNEWNKLKQFQSYLCVSRDPHNWMKDAFDWLEEEGRNIPKDFATFFLQRLKKNDNESRLSDKNNPNYEDVVNEEVANVKFPNINRYWFWRLDYYLWETALFDKDKLNNIVKSSPNFDKNVIEKYTFSKNRSIEHLHPQNESQDGKWGQDELEKNDMSIDSFGNLAMISQSLNSYQSNKPIQEKLAKIKKHIEDNVSVESLKLYFMYLKGQSENDKWTPLLAKEHQNNMLEILKNSYKPPQKQAE